MSDNPASWQPDPTGKHDHRYWDGTQWTDNVADAGVAATDPYEAPAPPSEGTEPATVTPGEAPTAVIPVEPSDTTASYPAAMTPPAAPPPYVPPTPVPDGGGSKSKRGLLIGGAILAAVALVVLAILVFGDDDEPTDPLADQNTTTTTDSSDGGVTDSSDGGVTDSSDGGFSDGLGNGDIEKILADTYAEMFNLSDDQAECLAGKVAGAIEDGELDQQQAATEIFSYLADCDISLEELGAN